MSTLVSAGPPPADDAVPDIVHELCRAIGDVHRDVAARVTREALDPIRNAAAAAASAHAGILESCGLADADAAPALPGRAIARYRTAVIARVLEPVLDVVDDAEPGSSIGVAWEEARARFHDLVERAPEELVGPEPAGLFRSRPEDPVLLRWHKSAIRLGRAAEEIATELGDGLRRTLGRPVTERNGRIQRVPLRDLVALHVELRLPPFQLDLVEVLAELLADPMATLHRAVHGWARAVLDAEVATDRLALHRADDEDAGPPSPEAAAHVAAVRAAAETLQAALEEIAAHASAEQVAAAELETLVVAEDQLVADIEMAGSPLQRRPPVPGRRDGSLRTLERRLDLWADWHRRTRATMRSTLSILGIRGATHTLLTGAGGDVADGARALAARLAATARTLRAERAGLARICDDCVAGNDIGALRRALDAVAGRLPDIIDDAITPLREDGAALGAAIDTRIARLQAAIAELPGEIAGQSRSSLDEPPEPDTGSQRFRPRALLSESFGVVRLERIRAATGDTSRAFLAGVDEAAQARGVVEYDLQAAATELSSADTPGIAASALEDARDLALGGLDRAAENLERIAAEAAARPRAFSAAVFDALHDGWLEVAARLRAGDVGQEPIRAAVHSARPHLREEIALPAAAARTAPAPARPWSLGSVLRADLLPQFGRRAVEAELPPDDERRRTLAGLADADRLVAELPLVYRRLFELHTVADRTALEGRAAELDVVHQHYVSWRAGRTDALVISGWNGAATASFFDAALDLLAHEGATIRRITFEQRTLDEAVLAARIAEALELGDDPPAALGPLADRILAEDDRTWPVVALDGVEMLLLRTSSDNGLIGPLLSFLSDTDARIFWVAGIARAAWRYIERVEPAAAGLVRHLPLAPLSRADLEAVIIGGHARSGLPLVFDAPVSPRPQLRRRLARAGDDAARQAILRTEFFDRLAHAAGPGIVLALFYWLRAAHFDEAGNRLRVRPLEPLGFGFLDTLGPDHAFALKAFLEHGTLCIAEHDRVLSVTRDVSRAIFASLANLHLIEPLTEGAPTLPRAQRDDVPWRMRALVLQPVLLLLRSRNLV